MIVRAPGHALKSVVAYPVVVTSETTVKTESRTDLPTPPPQIPTTVTTDAAPMTAR